MCFYCVCVYVCVCVCVRDERLVKVKVVLVRTEQRGWIKTGDVYNQTSCRIRSVSLLSFHGLKINSLKLHNYNNRPNSVVTILKCSASIQNLKKYRYLIPISK